LSFTGTRGGQRLAREFVGEREHVSFDRNSIGDREDARQAPIDDMRGSTIVRAPRTFHVLRMVGKYGG
jgi:hypothetical protein